MLSGLSQRPLIKLGTIPLLQFWKTGLGAQQANLMYAVGTGIRGDQLFRVYYSQKPLLRHIHLEVAAFARQGWRANPVFRRRDLLAEDELEIVMRFKREELNREYRMLVEQVNKISADGDIDRFERFAKETYRFFPSMDTMLRNIIGMHLFKVAKRKIRLENMVDSKKQFKSPELFYRAKTLFGNILEHCIQHAEYGGKVSVYGEDSTIGFQYVDENGSFADDHRMSWRSIRKGESMLGWKVICRPLNSGKMEILVRTSAQSFASPETVKKRKTTTQNLKIFGNTSYADIVNFACLFIRAQPFQGYRLTERGDLDISKSPIFQAIESSRQLIAPIAHNTGQI